MANMTNSISSQSVRSSQKKRTRRLPTVAEKVLDAPGLVDDYCKQYFSVREGDVHAYGHVLDQYPVFCGIFAAQSRP